MYAVKRLSELMEHIDARRWDALSSYLHPDFHCTYAHTGEVLDRQTWIRLNADYPGFDRLRVRELTGADSTAACRAQVTGFDSDGKLNRFECATFVRLEDGLIVEMTEVWTDVDHVAPEGTRPT